MATYESPVAQVVGIPTAVKDTEEEIQKMCEKVRPDMEQKLSIITFAKFEATTFISSQAEEEGTHYFVRILLADDAAVHVRIYQPLPYTCRGPVLQACQKKTLEAPLVTMAAEYND